MIKRKNLDKHEALAAMINGYQVQAENSDRVYFFNDYLLAFMAMESDKTTRYCNPNDINGMALFDIVGKKLF